MTKEELRAKYARIPTDFSEIEMLKNQLLDSGLLEAAQVDPAQAGKVFGVLEDGSIGLVESGPAPVPVEKGGYVMIDGHRYLVLDANEDLTEVKLMFADFEGSKYYDRSLGSEMLETFTTTDGTKQGLKYAGSALDTYCNETFLATLPQEVQDAIIEQTVVQDMYNVGLVDADETTVLQTKKIGSSDVYRVNKVSTESIAVGQRKIRSLNIADICAYLGTDGQTVLDGEILKEMIFGFAGTLELYSWLLDAYSNESFTACCFDNWYQDVYSRRYQYNLVVRPTFTINWKAFN